MIVKTHRTEGAAFNIRRQLHRIGNGNLNVELRLRKYDNLREIIEPFNRAVAFIRRALMEDVETIEDIAQDVQQLDNGEEIAAKLREVASRRRSMLDATP